MKLPSAIRCAVVLAVLVRGLGAAEAAPVAPVPPATDGSTVALAIADASARFSIPPSWIRAVMRVESGGNARALSPKGAIGLMQIMPNTWFAMRQRYHLGSDPYDPHDNILGGTALLRELYDRFGSGGFLAAYNAGPSRYLAFLTQGQPLRAEAQLYLAKLAAVLPELPIDGTAFAAALPHDWRSAALFAASWPAADTHVWAATRPDNPPAAVPSAGAASNSPSGATPPRLAPNTAGLFAALTPAVMP